MGRSPGRIRPPDKSEIAARAILRRYLESVRADFAGSVDAVVLTGSLAAGGYVAGPGDIDQITILRQDAAPGTEDRLQAGIDSAAAAYGRAVHLAPIVYRRADLAKVLGLTTVVDARRNDGNHERSMPWRALTIRSFRSD